MWLCIFLIIQPLVFVWIPGLYKKFVRRFSSEDIRETNYFIGNYSDLSDAAMYVLITLTNHGNIKLIFLFNNINSYVYNNCVLKS